MIKKKEKEFLTNLANYYASVDTTKGIIPVSFNCIPSVFRKTYLMETYYRFFDIKFAIKNKKSLTRQFGTLYQSVINTVIHKKFYKPSKKPGMYVYIGTDAIKMKVML